MSAFAVGTLFSGRTHAAKAQRASGGDGKAFYAYVGARTTRKPKGDGGRGFGIAVFKVVDDRWTQIQLVPEMQNPAFMCFDATQRFLYAVRGDAHELSAYRRDADTGLLRLLNSQPVQGKFPVHVAIDPTNRYLVTANYEASLSVLPRRDDGSLESVVQVVPTTGATGPHKIEQDHSKPHQARFDPSGRWVLSPDKGCDVVRTFSFDPATGKLAFAGTATAPEGAGCRHVVFHPTLPFVYLINELNSTLIAFRFDRATGALTAFQQLSSLPDDFIGFSRGSGIDMFEGRFIYVSNRGSETIGAYAIDQGTGRLTAIGWQKAGGATPRFFNFAPDGAMYSGNQGTDTITRLPLDRSTGRLAVAHVVTPSPTPSCILFAPIGKA
jgi:6-phosphogluconolactonase (cycloisomerase 2 family)